MENIKNIEEEFNDVYIDDVYGGLGHKSRQKSMDMLGIDDEYFDQFYNSDNWDYFDFKIPFIFKATAILTSVVCIASVGYVSYSIVKYLKNKH